MNFKNDFLIILMFSLAFCNCVFGEEIEKSKSYLSKTKTVQFSNDIFFNKDHKISNVFSYQIHSEISKQFENNKFFPKISEILAKMLPEFGSENFYFRSTFAITQTIQTPKNLSTSDLIMEDVPYAGMLTLELNLYSFNNFIFNGFGVKTGFVGPPSFSKQTQKIIHTIIQDVNPKGWKNQIDTEPILNINYMFQRKIFNNDKKEDFSFETVLFVEVSAGNLMSHLGTGSELRFGYNMPRGFNYSPDPTTFNMKFNALTNPELSNEYSFYFTIKLQGNYVYNNLFLDGNTFAHSHFVEKENYIGELFAGLHFENKNWGIHVNFLITSENVDKNLYPLAKGGEKLGSIIFDWRF